MSKKHPFHRIVGPLMGEVTGWGKFIPRYTWGGKGWGGAQLDDDGNALGFDCSGFACGVMWRCGWMSAKSWTNTDGLWAMGQKVQLGQVQPGDLILFGDNEPVGDMSHVGVVLFPGKQYLDAGGGGSRTKPGGSDWPPERGKVRVSKWSARADVQGFVRIREKQTAEDREALGEWRAHCQAAQAGQRPELPPELTRWPYQLRPAWRDYTDGGAGGLV